MNRIYSQCAEWLVSCTKGNTDDYDIYMYGIQYTFEQFIYIITCLGIAFFLKEFDAMVLLLIILFLTRSYIGGFHFTEFIHCYCFSVAVSVFILMASMFEIGDVGTIYVINITLIGLAYICLLSQSEEICDNEYEFYKKKLRRNLLLISVVTTVLYFFNATQELRLICYTFILILVAFMFDLIKTNADSLEKGDN